jgi:hypothetical protein
MIFSENRPPLFGIMLQRRNGDKDGRASPQARGRRKEKPGRIGPGLN